MKFLSLLIVVVLSVSSDKTVQYKDCFDYPQEIEELHSGDLYDSVRWILYNWLGPKKLDGVYYGEMELRFKDVFVRNDSMEIYFHFYAPDKGSTNKDFSTVVARSSVAFRQNTKERLWAFNYPFAAFSAGLEQGDKQLVSPVTDSSIKFLRIRRDIINECYLQLARKRQIVD